MLKTMFLAGAMVVALSASAPAFAQSRSAAAMPSQAALRAACDRALERRGRADASAAVRARCVTLLRARVAERRRTGCFYTRDPRHRGWSHGAHAFNVMTHRNRWPCSTI
jgi:hypothetical protein